MLQIKISADNERLLNRAKTEGELRGAVDMVLERIVQAKAAKEFKKAPASGAGSSPYYWRNVVDTLRATLGDDLRIPPFPDTAYYQTVYRYAKMYDLQGEKLQALATKVKETMKAPFDLRFILANNERIMAGTVAGQHRYVATTNNWRNRPAAPGTPLPSLPED